MLGAYLGGRGPTPLAACWDAIAMTVCGLAGIALNRLLRADPAPPALSRSSPRSGLISRVKRSSASSSANWRPQQHAAPAGPHHPGSDWAEDGGARRDAGVGRAHRRACAAAAPHPSGDRLHRQRRRSAMAQSSGIDLRRIRDLTSSSARHRPAMPASWSGCYWSSPASAPCPQGAGDHRARRALARPPARWRHPWCWASSRAIRN